MYAIISLVGCWPVSPQRYGSAALSFLAERARIPLSRFMGRPREPKSPSRSLLRPSRRSPNLANENNVTGPGGVNKRVLVLLAEWFDSRLLAITRANDGLATTARSSVVFASLVTGAHGHWLELNPWINYL